MLKRTMVTYKTMEFNAMIKILKDLWGQVLKFIKSLSAFSLGMLIGVCYGSVVATTVAYVMLKAME